jgi:glycosyltransferase involved in cell wall biosynthesis
MISDHAQTNTGVAVQSNHLIKGLLKTNKYEVVQLGAAVYHDNYETVKVKEDFTIIPINGFGDKDTIRSMLVSYVPDVLIMFSDSRFFGHIFEMEDEIHQICPIMWWHVWDNRPTPIFNKTYYDSIDTINCISELTYRLCKEIVDEEKLNHIPHSLPNELFYTLGDHQIQHHKAMILGKNKDDFICTWINRNTRRKRPGDVLKSWQMFLMNLENEYKHKNAILLMHTDPYDQQGMNLVEIAKNLNILENVRFSDQEVDFNKINILHNISDVHINIAHTEGFGLSTLEAMSVGKPIIATETGGLVRQLINPDTFYVHGVSLKPDLTTLSGTQQIPYLNEDYVSLASVSKAIMKMYKLGDQKRREIGLKAKKYTKNKFIYREMINKWDMSIEETLENWKSRYVRIRVEEIK